jgi:hypothetical protein
MKVEDDMSDSFKSIFIDDAFEDKSANLILLLATSVIGSWIMLIIAVLSPNVGWSGLIGAYVFGGAIGVLVGVLILLLIGSTLLPRDLQGAQAPKNKELI